MDENITIVLEYLKSKQVLTDLQKDIVDTYNTMSTIPFDRRDIIRKIQENNLKYPQYFNDIVLAVYIIGANSVPLYKLTNEELVLNLKMQLQYLCYLEIVNMQNK